MTIKVTKKELLSLLNENLNEEDDLFLEFNGFSDSNVIMEIGKVWPVKVQGVQGLRIEIKQMINGD